MEAVQRVGAGQTTSHAPQLASFTARSTQKSPQRVSPSGQVRTGDGPTAAHWPSMHCVPQGLPQKPQLSRSVAVFTQVAPHGVNPSPQETHVPPVQTPPGQAFEQEPQYPGSVWKSLQMP